MRAALFFLVGFLLLETQVMSQSCGTVGTEANRIYKELTASSRFAGGPSSNWEYIPIKIFIIRDDVGSPGPYNAGDGDSDNDYYAYTEDMVYADLAFSNDVYEDGRLKFYIDGSIEYIDNSLYSNEAVAQAYLPGSPDASEFTIEGEICSNYNYDSVLNVYYLPALKGAGGWASFPGAKRWARDRIFIDARGGRSVLSHEIGHYLNLYHTHQGISYDLGITQVEYANSANCGPGVGDEMCSTKGDPVLKCYNRAGSIRNVDPSSCNYIGGGEYPAGVPYDPPVKNVMSYAICCQNELTLEQLERAKTSFYLDRSYLKSEGPIGNVPCLAVGLEVQEYYTTGNTYGITNPYSSRGSGIACQPVEYKDIWFMFKVPADGIVSIKLENISFPSANLSAALYAGSNCIFPGYIGCFLNGNGQMPAVENYDLSSYTGQEVYLRVWPDPSTLETGFFDLCVYNSSSVVGGLCSSLGTIPTSLVPGTVDIAFPEVLYSTTPTLVWEGSGPALDAFDVYVYGFGGTLVYSTQTSNTEISIPSGYLFAGRKYYWKVANNVSGIPGCLDFLSNERHISIYNDALLPCSGLSSAVAILNAPGSLYAGGSISLSTTQPMFSWTPVPDATGYEVFVRQDPPDGPLVIEEFVGGTSWTPLIPTLLSAGSEYRWNVQAQFGSFCEGGYSERLYFNIDNDSSSSARIIAWEYWFNEDFDDRVFLIASGGSDFTFSAKVDASMLSGGINELHFRFFDLKEGWSHVSSQFFNKISTISVSNELTVLNYWFDDNYDDVFSTVLYSTALANLDFSVNTNSLSSGLHVVNFQVVDANENSTAVQSSFFNKVSNSDVSSSLIVGYEYWYDNDYSAKVFNAIDPAVSVDISALISTGDVSEGLHSLNMRSLDSKGRLSSTLSSFFYQDNKSSSVAVPITQFEYWFDFDTSNIFIWNTAPEIDLTFVESLDASMLTEGLHLLSFRFKDSRDIWSAVFTESFMVSTALPCNTPLGLNATPSINSALLNWSVVPDALGYRVAGRKLGSSSYSYLLTTASTKSVYGLLPGTTYEWFVQANCGSGLSVPSLVDFFITGVAKQGDSVIPVGKSIVYPVPFDDILIASIVSTKSVKVQIVVSDIAGRIVSGSYHTLEVGSNVIEFTTNIWPAGVYNLLILVDGEEQIFSVTKI